MKSLIRRRGVMIAVAVIALMTLTAGTAAAAANKAKFNAVGGVGLVGLAPGGSADSTFTFDEDGAIESIEVHTIGEVVFGVIAQVTACKESDKKSGTACDGVITALTDASLFSTHESVVKLMVTEQPHFDPIFTEVVIGTLKGKLDAELTLVGAVGSLEGNAELKIRSTAPATYACVVGLGPTFGPIRWCQIPGTALIPVDLHVEDTGNFEVAGEGVEMKGELTVIVDSTLIGATTGTIVISNGKAEFGD